MNASPAKTTSASRTPCASSATRSAVRSARRSRDGATSVTSMLDEVSIAITTSAKSPESCSGDPDASPSAIATSTAASVSASARAIRARRGRVPAQPCEKLAPAAQRRLRGEHAHRSGREPTDAAHGSLRNSAVREQRFEQQQREGERERIAERASRAGSAARPRRGRASSRSIAAATPARSSGRRAWKK